MIMQTAYFIINYLEFIQKNYLIEIADLLINFSINFIVIIATTMIMNFQMNILDFVRINITINFIKMLWRVTMNNQIINYSIIRQDFNLQQFFYN